MAKTQAERAATYRQRKRDETDVPNVTGVTELASVTQGVCKCCHGPTQHPKVVKCLACCTADVPNPPEPPNDTLPQDVIDQIEQQCFETTGEREGSHTRAAMTERALAYQRKMGKRGGGYTEPPVLPADNPLDVYSPDRWDKLQAAGYTFTAARAYKDSILGLLVAPPVPGDPAYGQTLPKGPVLD